MKSVSINNTLWLDNMEGRPWSRNLDESAESNSNAFCSQYIFLQLLEGPITEDVILPFSNELDTLVLSSKSWDGTKPGAIESDLTSIAVVVSPFSQKKINPSSCWVELVKPDAPRFWKAVNKLLGQLAYRGLLYNKVPPKLFGI